MKASQLAQLADRLLNYSFWALFFFVPLAMSNATSEVFEFNKIILVYALTVLILAAWVGKMILAGKFIFRKTLLDLPILIFLIAQLFSLLFSVDKHTSFWGYYSRWNGGFLSSLTFALLYWSFVSNLSLRSVLYALRFLLASALVVALWGIPAHFGFDPTCAVFGYGLNVDCWTAQFVPTIRIFSTLGQANWLAAWLVAVMPVGWALATRKQKPLALILYLLTSAVLFPAFVYTGSRSGFLGFLVAFGLFWGGVFLLMRKRAKALLLPFFVLSGVFLLLSVLLGTPFTPSLESILANRGQTAPETQQPTAITPSGDIRRIVWRGAIDIWRAYPVLGTGPETFAYSYYNFRPAEHNTTSEWDFLYNKAHNEYLNLAANTGTAGLISYLVLVGAAIFLMGKSVLEYPKRSKDPQHLYIGLSLLAGYASILVTNFFGFSVVPVQLLFFLYPAIAVVATNGKPDVTSSAKLSGLQTTGIVVLGLAAFYLLLALTRIWIADKNYAEAERLADAGQYVSALPLIKNAVSTSPSEPVYLGEFANITSALAQETAEAGQATAAAQLAQAALQASDNALEISPRHLNFLKSRTTMFYRLAAIDPEYLEQARLTLQASRKLAPTDAKIAYNLGIFHYRLGEPEQAIEVLQEAVGLKPDYRDARYLLALVLQEEKRDKEAIEQLEYILENINPTDAQAREKIEEFKK